MANNVDILDAAGSTKTVKTTDNTSVHTPHHNVDTCTTVTTVSSVTAVAGTVTIAGAVTNAGTFAVQAVCTNAGTFATQSVCTNAGTFAVQAAQSGTWNVTNVSGTVSLPTGASTAAKQPALGTAGTASTDVISVQGIAAMTPILSTLSGTNNIATVTTVTTLGTITNVVHVDDNAGSLTVDGAVTVTNATAANLKCEATIAAAQTIAATNAGTFAVQPGVATTGGESSLSALSTAAVYTAEVKGSAGQIYGVEIFNKGAAAVYARLYNQTGAPGSGDAANIIWRGIVPGSTTGSGFVKGWPNGKICSTGIGIRVSGAIADNDTTVLAANEVTINVGYK